MTATTTVPHYYTDTEGQVLTTAQVEIIGIFWISDEASGKDIATSDDFLLSDSYGNRIIGKRASFAGDDLGITPCKPLFAKGITVTALNGGVCYVWVA